MMKPSQWGDKTPTLSNIKPARHRRQLPSLILIPADEISVTGTIACLIKDMEFVFVFSHTMRKYILNFGSSPGEIMTSWFLPGDSHFPQPFQEYVLCKPI